MEIQERVMMILKSVLIFSCFAMIAQSRFGSRNPNFADFNTALFTQINALLGPPGLMPVDLYSDKADYTPALL